MYSILRILDIYIDIYIYIPIYINNLCRYSTLVSGWANPIKSPRCATTGMFRCTKKRLWLFRCKWCEARLVRPTWVPLMISSIFPVVEDIIETETYGNFNSKSHHWYMIHTSSNLVGPWWMGLFTSQQVIGQWIELRTHRWRSVNLWPPGAVDRPVSIPISDLGNFPKLGNVVKKHWKSHLHNNVWYGNMVWLL